MEQDFLDIEKQIKYIELLFANKQLDEFVNRVEKYILPYLTKEQHLVSEHLIQKEKTHLKQQQLKEKKQQLKQKKQELIQTEPRKLEEYKQSEKVDIQLNKQLQTLELSKQLISDKQKDANSTTQNCLFQIKKSSEVNRSEVIAKAIKQSKINILQKYEEMKLVLFKIQREMKKLQTPMVEKGQWKINKINSTSVLGVKTKGTLVELRYEGIVETNIFNLCVMIYLSQLWKEWVPFCTGSKTIAQPSPLQKIVLMDLKIPFLTERYSYLHGIAVDRITKSGKLYIYAEGISHEKDLLTQVHKANKTEYEKKVSKSVVLDAKFMVCEIGNQGNGKYSVKVYGMVDSHMPLLPEKVVGYIVKQLGGMIFEKVVVRAKDIKNTPWQRQLKQNEKREVKNPFYHWLHQRITNWDKSQVARKSKI